MITVVLVEPEWASNVGSVARVMANFGFDRLVLVDPKCKKTDFDAIRNSKHGISVLKKAKVAKMKFLDRFDYIIGTTSKVGTDYNIPRCPIMPEELLDTKNKEVAILFGREGDGLRNEEIKKCDFMVSIPTSRDYPALNLSHSVAILLYILSRTAKGKIGEDIMPIGKKEKENLLKIIDKKIDSMGFSTEEKKQTQKTVWKRLIGKGFLTNREAYALFGFFRKIK